MPTKSELEMNDLRDSFNELFGRADYHVKENAVFAQFVKVRQLENKLNIIIQSLDLLTEQILIARNDLIKLSVEFPKTNSLQKIADQIDKQV